MSDLTREQLSKLILEGWRCEDYGEVCKIPSHRGVVNRLIYDPSGKLTPQDIADEKNFSGNAVVLHVGEVIGKLSPEELSDEALVVPPGKFVFFLTRECVNIPFDIDGSLFMVPHISNLGLHFFTLGHIDPGFHGKLTATLLNMTDNPIKLDRHEGCLYFVLSRTDAVSAPHPKFHEKPQMSIQDAQRNLSFNLNPGFALTSTDFATKEELRSWQATIVAIIIGLFGILVAILVVILGWLLARIP